MIAFGWNILFSLIFLVLGKRLWRESNKYSYKTPIDFFTAKYHSKPLNALVILIMISLSIPYIKVQFMGGGIIIEMATGGAIPWKLSTLLFFIVMIIYLWSGGLRAVAWTDALYTFLIIAGMLLIGIIFISMTGGVSKTFQTIAQQSPEALNLPKTVNGMNSYGFWFSMLLIMPLGECMMPQIWTRTYAIREKKTFYIIPLLLSISAFTYVGTMLAGNAAIVLEPALSASSDYILPILLVKYVSPPLMALIMCCVVAACLSTVNSQLHSLSLLITMDVYKTYFNKRATEKRLVFIGKLVILLVAAFSYLQLLSSDFSSITETVYPSFCGMMQLIVPVIGGLCWKNATASGALSGLSAGVAISLIFSLWKPFTYFFSPGLMGLIVNAILFIFIGLASHTREKADIKRKVFKSPVHLKLLWSCLFICFVLIGSPLVIYINKLDVTFFGIPAIYSFVLSICTLMCILIFIGFRLSWGDKNKKSVSDNEKRSP